jgi:ubiquinone/menaquinone biosynthesis C-methylase UbiE
MAPTLSNARNADSTRDDTGRRRKRLHEFFASKDPNRLSVQEYRRRVRKHYDGPAGAMLSWASLVSLHEPLAGRLFRRRDFDLDGCRRILDVGAGAGQLLRHVLRHADPQAEIVFFDLSHAMLQRARSRLRSDRPRAVTCDMARLPFADRTFDCVTCGWVLEHLPDPRPGLAELARVMQPGGKLLLLATEDTLTGALCSRTWNCRTHNRAALRAVCDDSGLPWARQLWFSGLHRALHLGGILVEAHRTHE